MHPVIARIPPSFRTAFLATLVARSAVALRLPDFDYPTFGYQSAEEWTLIIAGHLLFFLCAVGIYSLVRRHGLPQTAERATWIWATFPLIATLQMSTLGWLTPAIAGMALVASAHPVAGTLIFSITALNPTMLPLIPVFAVLAWSVKGPQMWRVGAAILPAFVAALSIVYSAMEGGLRDLTLFSIRNAWHPNSWDFQDYIWIGVPLLLALLSVVHFKRLPASWCAMAVLVLVPVALQNPALALLLPVFAVAPLFAQVSLVAQEPEIERVILGLQVAAIFFIV